ncbi:unnamed protein product [Bursaphelenchus xylophilus]|nr:unnamed protein product [Bursaphelenchus xylophilus]CAG9114141.1 unnamed protein product [Bursaphelenchus xylophilus]
MNLLLVALLIPCSSGYINDFSINITYPGIEDEDNTRVFLVDTFGTDDFIWHADEYSKLVGAERTYDEKKSSSYYDPGREYEFKYVDENKESCYLEGSAAFDQVELLPYLRRTVEFGMVKSATCGNDAIKRSTSFNGKLRAGKVSFRQFVTQTVGKTLAEAFRNRQLCLHISVSEDMKIKQTVVAVGAAYNKARHINEAFNHKEYMWALPTTYFKVGRHRYEPGYNRLAVFMSAYDKIKLPWPYFDQIVEESEAKYDNASGKYLVDCGRELHLELGIEKGEFKIPFHALLRRRNPQDSQCELLLEHWPERYIEDVHLGIPFFVNNGVCFYYLNGAASISFYNATYDENSPIFPNTFGTYMSVVNE